MDASLVWKLAEEVPPEWYGGDIGEMERLVEQLLERRGRIRAMIESFRESHRIPFPLWGRPGSEINLRPGFPQTGWETKTGAGKLVM